MAAGRCWNASVAVLALVLSGFSLCESAREKNASSTATNPLRDSSPTAEVGILGEVLLELVDASTGRAVQQARIDTKVQLRARLDNGENATQKGISPHNCRAESTSTKKEKQLTGFDGCAVKGAPAGCMTGSEGMMTSPSFPLVELATPGEHVTVTCYFEVCDTVSDAYCEDRCSYFKQHNSDVSTVTSRRVKRTRELQIQTASTSIRVLPSVGHHHHHHHGNKDGKHDGMKMKMMKMMKMKPMMHQATAPSPSPEGGSWGGIPMSQGGPLLYLNPITCSLFLLLLALFLGFYVSFLRSLRTSLHEIKHEIEVQRSRDKFLVG